MELQFAEVLNLLLLSTVLIQSAFIARSIPREAWENFWKEAGHAASKTENTTDDKIVAGSRSILTPVLERFNLISGVVADTEESEEEIEAVG